MARDLNSVVIIGRLTRDPEVRYTPSGAAVAKISVANNDSYKQNNEFKDYVSYFDVTVWGNQAVNCQKYLHKGSQVAIQGRLRQDRWEDKTTGKTVSKVEIIAENVHFMGSPNNGNGGNGGQFNGSQFQSQPQNNGGQNNYGMSNQGQNPYQQTAPQPRPQNNVNPWAEDTPSGPADYYNDTFNQGGMPDGGYGGSDDDIPF